MAEVLNGWFSRLICRVYRVVIFCVSAFVLMCYSNPCRFCLGHPALHGLAIDDRASFDKNRL